MLISYVENAMHLLQSKGIKVDDFFKQWLESELNVKRRQLNLYLNGKSTPTLEKAFVLAHLFNLKITEHNLDIPLFKVDDLFKYDTNQTN